VVRYAGPAEPGPPEPYRLLDPGERVLGVGRTDEPVLPRQSTERALAGLQRAPSAGRDATLDADGQVRYQPDHTAGTVGVHDAALAFDLRPRSRFRPVVEDRLADELDLHRAVDDFDRADEQVLGVGIGRRPRVRRDRVRTLAMRDGQGVVDHQPAGRCV